MPAVPQAPPVVPQTPNVAPVAAPDELTPIPHGGLTIEELAAWVKKIGLSPEVVTGESGARHLVIRIKNTPFNIFMRDGKEDRFQSLELAAGFSTQGSFDTSQLNDWNSKSRWIRAYSDDVKDPWIEMDIDLWPGGTYESLNDQLVTWLNMVAGFMEKYGIK